MAGIKNSNRHSDGGPLTPWDPTNVLGRKQLSAFKNAVVI